MVTADEIRDSLSLEEWLRGRSKEDALCMAMRTACRVAPMVWSSDWHDTPLVSLVVCRQLLVAGVACRGVTRGIEDAARAATTHSNAYLEAVALAATSYDDTVQGIANTVATIVYAGAEGPDTAASAATRVLAGAGHVAEGVAYQERSIWERLREDAQRLEAGDDPLAAPLWSIPAPDFVRQNEAELRLRWAADPAFGFWLRWWDGILSGKQLPWDLQEKVALIPDQVWEQGPEAVAEAIREIEGDDASRANREPTSLPRALERNRRAILLQLDALLEFVSNEIDRLRGPNSYSRREHQEQRQRIEKLSKIIEAVTLMREAMDEEPNGSTALVVMDAQLPAVVKAADESVKLGGEPQVSEVIATMSMTIKHLTDSGTPGNIATAFAFADYCWRKIKSWRQG